MHKKILSVGLAGLMTMAIAVPSVSAYNTKVNYDGHLQEQRLDIDGDNTEDITINDQVTFGVKVPATVNVDGADGTAAIAGVIDTSVTLTAPESLEMQQDEVAANKLTALINMGEDNTLTLGTSTQKISRVTANVNSKWDNNKPLMGNWSGNFEYNINVKSSQDLPILQMIKYKTLDDSEQAMITFANEYAPGSNTVLIKDGMSLPDDVSYKDYLLEMYNRDGKQYTWEELLKTDMGIVNGSTATGKTFEEEFEAQLGMDIETFIKIVDGNYIPLEGTTYEILNTYDDKPVTCIDTTTFGNWKGLASVIIPDSINKIAAFAFTNNDNLTSIVYKGTKEQWNAIEKQNNWCVGSPNVTIHCVDGDIVL